jgi:sugar phosphate isomerase/epimerase
MKSSHSQRREFLKQAALLATAAAFTPPALRAATPTEPKNLSEPDFVRLAVATICTDGFGNQHHEPAFQRLPQLGIKNVEFNVWYPDTITPTYILRLKTRCVRAGLTPVCLQGSAFGGDGANGVLKDVGHKTALMYGARDLGCRRIKCTGAPRGTQGGLKSVIEICKELAPAAEELGQLILLENHAKNVLENIPDYEEIFSQIDSPNVGLCLDAGHFEGVGIDLHEVVEKFHSRLLHVDLKDCRKRGAGHDTVVYGEGVTDFKAFLDHLRTRNYRGYLVLEQAWAQPREPVIENLRKGVELFKSYERNVG